MPRNLTRYYGSNNLHFITASCYRRQPLLNTAQSCDLFVDVLERMRHRYGFVVLGYVVMPEHVHLLLSEPQVKTLSTVMQAIKLGFVRRVHSSRIWHPRCDFNVWTENKRIEKLRYIHRNPVKRGLVASPEQWPWSSFRFYLSGEAGPVRINDTAIMKMKIHPRSPEDSDSSFLLPGLKSETWGTPKQ